MQWHFNDVGVNFLKNASKTCQVSSQVQCKNTSWLECIKMNMMEEIHFLLNYSSISVIKHSKSLMQLSNVMICNVQKLLQLANIGIRIWLIVIILVSYISLIIRMSKLLKFALATYSVSKNMLSKVPKD